MTEKAQTVHDAGHAGTQSSDHGWQGAVEEWRSNWRVGIAAFMAIGLSHDAYQALSSLFVLPLQEAFGWSRGQIAFAHYSSLVVAFAAPFVGRAVDRFGARRIMLGGMTLSILIYLGLASMNGSLALFYMLSVLAGVIGLSASGLTCSRVVSQYFVRSRGISLAIARSGLALASAALPTVLFAIIARFGWRAGYATEALLVLAIALPAVWFWIGSSRTPTAAEQQRPDPDLPTWLQLLRERRVWLLCVGAGLGYAPATAIMTQLQPLLISKGIEAEAAAALVGMAGIASFVGALITGSLVDRFWAPGIAFLFACGSAAGTCLLVWQGALDGPMAGLTILLIGLGLGAEIDVVAYMVARYFGIRSFSTIYGMTVFFIAFASAVGASMLGAAFDRNGNYDAALLVIAASFMAAGCVYLMMGRYPRHED
ncbi:major facilitator superfamily MFS_1 [Sphingobium chlorophenolicum L-1]|uniref:Major facilitator superfamily MFS_1 n=1 Tax=Sphingobium chlorophenolicum L-1 TaxID=690566 RepID=F6F148_SPHCR|nr:MFS transporter [Sphingobium chlorophenolicum]AEG51264.1 major facilitator superfamily MFS_1 [Sphingobium chlorophenolicum L-1]